MRRYLQEDMYTGLAQSADSAVHARVASEIVLAAFDFATSEWSQPSYPWGDSAPLLAAGHRAAILRDSSGSLGMYVWGGSNRYQVPAGHSNSEHMFR